MLTTKLLLYLLAVMVLISCESSNEEMINLVLDKRIKAFELKDPEIYSECIHEQYRTVSGKEIIDKKKLVSKFSDHLSIIEMVSFRESDRYIYINGNDARAMMLSSIEVKINNHSVKYKAKEVVNLSKSLGQWKITKESMLDLLSGTMTLIKN